MNLTELLRKAKTDDAEYLSQVLLGREEILRFAQGVHNRTVDACIQALEADGDFAGAALLDRQLRGAA